MKSRYTSVVRRVRAGLVGGVIAATLALPAQAVDLPFSQTAGFFAGNATMSPLLAPAALPNAGFGGLEFSTPVIFSPQPALPDATNNLWKFVAWGCSFPLDMTTCANGGVASVGVGFADPTFNLNRSSLAVQGQSGNLDDVNWKDITVINHNNKPIAGESNVLKSVEINAFLRLGSLGVIVDTPSPTKTTINFRETLNSTSPCEAPVTTFAPTVTPVPAPANPLGSNCDDFVIVSGLDLSSVFIPVPSMVGNVVPLYIDFRLSSTVDSGALVCDGINNQGGLCGGYNGREIIVYTAEGRRNTLSVQAKLRPADVPPLVPLFVIGDVEPHSPGTPSGTPGDVVNFWGAQWWKNNFMSGFVSSGVASFKGYANHADVFCGGKWESRPGNSSNPPDTIPAEIAVIVTDTVEKIGPNISGNIKQIVLVRHDGIYAPAPGHRGNGPVVKILCSLP